MNIKASIKQALSDRSFVIAVIVTALASVAVLVLCAISIRPSEIQVPIRNTVFGITYTYREQWLNELSFAGFAIVVALFNTALSVRLYGLKNRQLALATQWLATAVLGITFLMLLAIFNVISVVL